MEKKMIKKIVKKFKILKYFNPSTNGIIIGILSVLVFVLLSIFCIAVIQGLNAVSKEPIHNPLPGDNYYEMRDYFDKLSNQYTNAKQKQNLTSTTCFSFVLVLSVIMIFISGLLIMGIVKKRHNLMLPWLIIFFVGYTATAIYHLTFLIVMIATSNTFGPIADYFFGGVFTIGGLTLTLWEIYKLYKYIRDNKADTQDQVTSELQVEDEKDHKVSTIDEPAIIIQKC